MKPKISIIVPVYNVERYLTKCINSILSQSFKDFELILVNDGSTDNSLSICEKYTDIDKRIKLVSQINKGLSAARNTGLRYANGNYICFIDSDDFVEKDYLRLLWNNIEKYNSDISICEYYLTDAKGKKYAVAKFNEPHDISFLSGRKTFSYFYKDNYVANVVAWNKIYKKHLFDNIKYDEGRYFEDELIALPLFYKAKKVSFIRIPLYNYVQRQGSIMRSPVTFKKIQDKTLMYRERMAFFKKNKDEVMYKLAVQQYKNWLIDMNILRIKGINNSKLQQEYRKYSKVRSSNSLKIIFKDTVGYINLRFLSKIVKYERKIAKNQ